MSARVEVKRKVLKIIPVIKPLSTPRGWAECGGKYRYKFMGFSYSLETMPLGVTVWDKSRKIAVDERSVNSHRSFP
jgi:hypothetical protein